MILGAWWGRTCGDPRPCKTHGPRDHGGRAGMPGAPEAGRGHKPLPAQEEPPASPPHPAHGSAVSMHSAAFLPLGALAPSAMPKKVVQSWPEARAGVGGTPGSVSLGSWSLWPWTCSCWLRALTPPSVPVTLTPRRTRGTSSQAPTSSHRVMGLLLRGVYRKQCGPGLGQQEDLGQGYPAPRGQPCRPEATPV